MYHWTSPSHDITGHHWASLHITGFYWAPLDVTGYHWTSLGFSGHLDISGHHSASLGHHWTSLGVTVYHGVLLDIWVSLGFSGHHWASLGIWISLGITGPCIIDGCIVVVRSWRPAEEEESSGSALTFQYSWVMDAYSEETCTGAGYGKGW